MDYRKPDGTITSDADEYVKAWSVLADQICPPGWELYGFDPGISLRCEYQTVSLPTNFVKALISWLSDK